MAKKVFLGVGHGGSDSGAVKYLVEKDVNLNMALACRDELVRHGVEVCMSRTKDENDTLQQEIAECNAFAPDLAIDIHNNAGEGDGAECYHSIVGGMGKTLAQNIEAEIKKIGQNSRGCKTRVGAGGTDYYGFIRETDCPAVIVEGVFVDNKADAAQADTLKEQQDFGAAIAKGALRTLNIACKELAGAELNEETDSKPTTTNKEPTDIYYRVMTKKHGWLSEVKNLKDYAGWQESPIVAFMVRVNHGEVKYRCHVQGGGWLPYVTGYNKTDHENGYAGNGQIIDAIEIILSGKKKAMYRVAPVGGNYYAWQFDNEKSGGQDGYAGLFGQEISRVQVVIA